MVLDVQAQDKAEEFVSTYLSTANSILTILEANGWISPEKLASLRQQVEKCLLSDAEITKLLESEQGLIVANSTRVYEPANIAKAQLQAVLKILE